MYINVLVGYTRSRVTKNKKNGKRVLQIRLKTSVVCLIFDFVFSLFTFRSHAVLLSVNEFKFQKDCVLPNNCVGLIKAIDQKRQIYDPGINSQFGASFLEF